MRIEFAEVAREFEAHGVNFEVGQILMGEYVQQGLRDTLFRFPVTTPSGERRQITIGMSSKRLIPCLDNITLR